MTTRGRYTVRAVVVGAGINGLGVLRSLARAGVPTVVVANSREQPAMHSRHGRKIVYADGYPGALADTLGTLAAERPGERAVLLLTEEETVRRLAGHYGCLRRQYRLTMPPPAVLMPLLHKSGIRASADACGICLPRTLWVRKREQLNELDGLRMPVVIKPAARDAHYARNFAKAYRIHDRDQARALLERILPVLPDLIVQEWIQGADSDLYFCLQYIPPTGRGEPISFTGRKIRSWPPQVGGTASCVGAPEAHAIARMTTDFFRHAGVTGLASMEYKYEPNTSQYVIVEPTVGRTDFQEEVATLNGVNLPLAAYCGCLGYTTPKMQQTKPPTGWRERTSDLRSAQATPPGETRLPRGAVMKNAIWRLDDPGPAIASFALRVRVKLTSLAGSGSRDIGPNQC